MQLPMILGLRRSRLWVALFAGLAALSALGLLLTPWPPAVRGLAFLAWGLALARGIHQSRQPLPDLRLSANGELAVRRPGALAFVPVTRLKAVTAHPWLVVVRWKDACGMGSVCLLPDVLPPDQWRALCVWLRWRAVPAPAADAVP